MFKIFCLPLIFYEFSQIYLKIFKYANLEGKILFWVWSKKCDYFKKVLNMIKKNWTEGKHFWTCRWNMHELISTPSEVFFPTLDWHFLTFEWHHSRLSPQILKYKKCCDEKEFINLWIFSSHQYHIVLFHNCMDDLCNHRKLLDYCRLVLAQKEYIKM